MSISIQHIEEDLSRAHVQAISALAGMIVRIGDRSHDYTIDGAFHTVMLKDGKRREAGFTLEFQLKASINVEYDEDSVKYDFDAETYNFLVDRARVPRTTPVILVLLALPREHDQWLFASEEQMILRRCCYWTMIDGEPTTNTSTKRIIIPREQLLTPESLKLLLKRIEDGEPLL